VLGICVGIEKNRPIARAYGLYHTWNIMLGSSVGWWGLVWPMGVWGNFSMAEAVDFQKENIRMIFLKDSCIFEQQE